MKSPRQTLSSLRPIELLAIGWTITFGFSELSTARAQGNVVLSGTAIANPRSDNGELLERNQLALMLVDRSGDGFAVQNEGSLRVGDPLSHFVGHPDDVVVATHASAALIPGQSHGIPGTAKLKIDTTSGLLPGKAFGILLFDRADAGSKCIPPGARYAFVTDPTWKLPTNGSNTQFHQSPGPGEARQLNDVRASRYLPQAQKTTFALWAAEKLGTEDLSPSMMEPDGDPDGDQLSNLYEYALGLDPLSPNLEAKLHVAQEKGRRRDAILLRYFYPLNRSDVIVFPEFSHDLLEWHRSAGDLQTRTHSEIDGQVHVTLQATTESQSCLFARLAVELDPNQ